MTGVASCGMQVSQVYPHERCRYHKCSLMWDAGTTGVASCGMQVPQVYPHERCRYHRCSLMWDAGITGVASCGMQVLQVYPHVGCRYYSCTGNTKTKTKKPLFYLDIMFNNLLIFNMVQSRTIAYHGMIYPSSYGISNILCIMIHHPNSMKSLCQRSII